MKRLKTEINHTTLIKVNNINNYILPNSDKIINKSKRVKGRKDTQCICKIFSQRKLNKYHKNLHRGISKKSRKREMCFSNV